MAYITLLLLGLALIHALAFIPATARRFPRLRCVLASGLLVLDSLLAGAMLMELYFQKIHDQSDGFNLTHAGRTWFDRHWKPVNSLGYRDAEPELPSTGQNAVVVLGDSFAAGHGVKNPADRFPDVAGRILGPGFRVYNVSKIGWDTLDETKALQGFPVKPGVVVLSYYLNDIFNAASKAGYPLAFSVNLPTGLFKALTDHSAMFDYVYWRLSRGGNLSGGAGSFWDTLKGAYADQGVWSAHAAEMAELAAYCREKGVPLVVLVFPMLQACGESAPLTAKVAGEFARLGAEVLDLAPVFAGRPPGELVVNPLDAHPNEKVHAEVGRLLAAQLEKMVKMVKMEAASVR